MAQNVVECFRLAMKYEREGAAQRWAEMPADEKQRLVAEWAEVFQTQMVAADLYGEPSA